MAGSINLEEKCHFIDTFFIYFSFKRKGIFKWDRKSPSLHLLIYLLE